MTFEYPLPTSLLIPYVKAIFNHGSGEEGRSRLRFHRVLTCISGKLILNPKPSQAQYSTLRRGEYGIVCV